MKAKRKVHPRRNLLRLLMLLSLLLGGYFSLPLAQSSFMAWWADDPFTPICDVPHLEVVYTSSVNLYHRHQGIQPEQFSTLQGEFRTLRWSPDFETLYMSTRSVQQDYQFLLHANNDLEILPAEFRDWFWSPNGIYAAAISQTGNSTQLRIYNEQAGESHSMASQNIIAQGTGIGGVVWSPNSQRIAFSMNEEVHIIENQNGEWKEIFVYPSNVFPLWSPDSELIAFSSNFLGVYHVETGELIWETWEIYRAAAWGEQGIIGYTMSSSLVNRGGEDGYEDIFIADLETQTVQWLADSNHTFITGWSQSNEAFLYSPESMSFSYLHFMEDSKKYPFLYYINPQFTPDGRYVGYQDENGWLYLFDMENRKPCRLFEAELQAFYLYTWRIIPQS
jgi:Tol biopolymer transport system component